MLDQAAIDVIGRKIALSFEEFAEALDPAKNVASVKTVGGPAPQEVTRMLQARNQLLVEARPR
jgi:hypothetical protein